MKKLFKGKPTKNTIDFVLQNRVILERNMPRGKLKIKKTALSYLKNSGDVIDFS